MWSWLKCKLGWHSWSGAFGQPYDPKTDGRKMVCGRCGAIRYYSRGKRRWIVTTARALYSLGHHGD